MSVDPVDPFAVAPFELFGFEPALGFDAALALEPAIFLRAVFVLGAIFVAACLLKGGQAELHCLDNRGTLTPLLDASLGVPIASV